MQLGVVGWCMLGCFFPKKQNTEAYGKQKLLRKTKL